MDSLPIFVGLAGLLMAPFWAMWWDWIFRKGAISRGARVAAVLVMSTATCLVVFVAPLMWIFHGYAQAIQVPLWFLWTMAVLLLGPGVALQIFCALSVSLRA